MAKTLRERFCNHKRQLNRRAMRYIGMAIVGLLLIATVQSHLDRRGIRREFVEMRRQADLSRKMLDARARIQTTLVMTGNRRGAFTEEEKRQISELWEAAEYNLVSDNPFK